MSPLLLSIAALPIELRPPCRAVRFLTLLLYLPPLSATIGLCRCTELWAEGDFMRETEDGPFAVFVKTVRRSKGMVVGANAICDQADWDAMERNQPGQQPLIRGGIASEVDA